MHKHTYNKYQASFLSVFGGLGTEASRYGKLKHSTKIVKKQVGMVKRSKKKQKWTLLGTRYPRKTSVKKHFIKMLKDVGMVVLKVKEQYCNYNIT